MPLPGAGFLASLKDDKRFDMEFRTADLYDDHSDQVVCVEPMFRAYGGLARFGGPITTLKVHEDNSLVRETLSQPGQGGVLVVDGGGSLRCALVGDRLAQLAIDQGWHGILVYGCIRDVAVIDAMPIGIRALNTTPVKSVKRGVGLRDEVVTFGGVTFRPGAYLYADQDGILVSAQALH